MAEGGVRHYTEWTPRHIRRSRYEYEDESKEASTIMNLLGYGPVIRQTRREAWKEWDRLLHASLHDGDALIITAGSKVEGLTCMYESDRDSIFVQPYTVCLEDGVDETTIPGHINVFKMNMQICNAGYCTPLLVRLAPSGPNAIPDSLCDDGHGRILLSSTYFIENVQIPWPRSPTIVDYARAGPSLPSSHGPFRNDSVAVICCNCPVILQKWASRARHWPPPDIVEKLISMGGFVTPIGFKGSEYNHIEWRICFNTAETVLVNNLNDTQVKVFVILKMIVNDVLKPMTKEITSYILKNIVFWLAENNPHTLFHSGSLFHWLHEGLDILRNAISFSQLPYYMISERNLMAERAIDVEQQRVLVSSITDMMEEGPRILLRLRKIRQAIICHPEPLLWYSNMRTELEKVELEFNNRLSKWTYMNSMVDKTDNIVQLACATRKQEIVYEVYCRLHREGRSLNDVINLNVRERMLS